MAGLYRAVIHRLHFLSQLLGLPLMKSGNSQVSWFKPGHQVKELMVSSKDWSLQCIEVLVGSEIILLLRQKMVKILKSLLPKKRGPRILIFQIHSC